MARMMPKLEDLGKAQQGGPVADSQPVCDPAPLNAGEGLTAQRFPAEGRGRCYFFMTDAVAVAALPATSYARAMIVEELVVWCFPPPLPPFVLVALQL